MLEGGGGGRGGRGGGRSVTFLYKYRSVYGYINSTKETTLCQCITPEVTHLNFKAFLAAVAAFYPLGKDLSLTVFLILLGRHV